jgi:predicted 3-demethylubiquinone-9 3-methyltransferase (glyoxalase superfamily)
MTVTTQKITPFLWFENNNAEEAMQFYTSVFKNSKIISIERYPEGATEAPMKGMGGKVLTGIFELDGVRFMALDGGPLWSFSGATSFYVECENQEEVDELWEKLSADPQAEQCGWLKDKYGLSWQIIPKQLGEYLSSPEKEKAGRAMQAMLQMKKIDIATLKKAYDGK